jgi:hypothetical protein
MSFMNEGQGYCSLLKGLVLRVVVAKNEDNTSKSKKVMIQVQVFGRQRHRQRQRQRRQDYNNTKKKSS